MAAEILENVWYFALTSKELRTGQSRSLVICSEPIVFFRNLEGRTVALRDICPHRGIPLSYGKVEKGEIECPYHGWTFAGEGHCTHIPSLTPDQDLDCRKIKVRAYRVFESQGLIWVFMSKLSGPELEEAVARAPQVPQLEFWNASVRPRLSRLVPFRCHIDHAVIGLMDPAHGPYVHQSWFWRSKASMKEKKKEFGPIPFGFQMKRHRPSTNSKAYRIFGGQPTTEISFSLPGVRVEVVKVGNGHFVSYTALTPVDASHTRINQMVYWDLPWLGIFKPLIAQFARIFLNQDRRAVEQQQDGLKFNPSLMLIKDADTQAKWYFALKNEWLEIQKSPREFLNPVKDTELRWRS